MFDLSEPTNSAKPTLSSAGSHVRTSASPGTALASLVNDLVYGTSSDGLLARFDPDSCSWRTFQLSLFGEEPRSLHILPRWGMTRGGELWQRPTPERPTSAAVGGAWVTATASDTISVRTPESMAAHFAKHRPGRTTPPSLREHVQYGNNRPATPAASDYKRGPISPQAFEKSHSPTLPELLTAEMWMTPTSMDTRRRMNMQSYDHPSVRDMSRQMWLNPEWVEQLMGYPAGYTDIGSQPDPAPSIRGSRRARSYRVVHIGSTASRRWGTVLFPNAFIRLRSKSETC